MHDQGQIRCPQCGMSVELGQRSLKPSKDSAGTVKETPDFSPDETGAETDTQTDLFSLNRIS